jgi:hypothetical protein
MAWKSLTPCKKSWLEKLSDTVEKLAYWVEKFGSLKDKLGWPVSILHARWEAVFPLGNLIHISKTL